MARALAIDLGSANTVVVAPGKGIVLNEPTVVAMEERTGEVLAMGHRAWREIDDAPGRVVPVRPMRKGAVVDFDVTERMLRLVLDRVGGTRWGGPRVLIAVSALVTPVERRAVIEAASSAGARSVELIAEAVAAAIGAGLSIDEPTASFIVDIGGATTEAAIISMGGVVTSKAERVGGYDVDDAIRRLLLDAHGVNVGDRTAEQLKREVGSAHPTPEEPKAEISGRDIASGAPRSVVLSSAELRDAIEEPVRRTIGVIRAALAQAPPELSHDVLERGMTLAGGGGMLRGLDQRITAETTIPVHPAAAPLSTVAVGCGMALQALDRMKDHGMLLT